MSTEQKASEQNALATKLSGFWTNFKGGKIIGYKWMAIILISVAVIGVTWYILAERSTAASKRWMDLDDANTEESLKEISQKMPGSIQDKIARLQTARALLGDSGIELLGNGNPEVRTRGVSNIEKSREMFQTLLEDFKDSPGFKAQCLLGLAKAEAALVAVPAGPNQLTEYKGKVPRVVEYLDQLHAIAADNTSWSNDTKKLADALRDDKSQSYQEFISVQRRLFTVQGPLMPRPNDPFGPSPFGPGPLGPGPVPPAPK